MNRCCSPAEGVTRRPHILCWPSKDSKVQQFSLWCSHSVLCSIWNNSSPIIHQALNTLQWSMQLPKQYRSEECSLEQALVQMGSAGSVSSDEVRSLCARLPRSLACARAFLCTLDREWRYEFGDEYSLGSEGSMPAIGTDQNPPVRVILYGLLRLQQYLDNADFEMYLNRLANCDKHFAFLAELDPILRQRRSRALTTSRAPKDQVRLAPIGESISEMVRAACLRSSAESSN